MSLLYSTIREAKAFVSGEEHESQACLFEASPDFNGSVTEIS